eukprot:scaffold122709_cov36-Prasinocladus_malaysianus.AAC.2
MDRTCGGCCYRTVLVRVFVRIAPRYPDAPRLRGTASNRRRCVVRAVVPSRLRSASSSEAERPKGFGKFYSSFDKVPATTRTKADTLTRSLVDAYRDELAAWLQLEESAVKRFSSTRRASGA